MILKGDCIEVMKAMKSNSVDAIVTDPPYGLEFMGKEWDKLWDKREFGIDEYSKKSYTCSDGSTRKTNPVSRKLNNPNYKAGIEAQLWHTQWLTEAYRVLKPGGSMLVMGGTRTSHRLACAIEDSGFIIKDTLMWIYGSGFPKAQDLGKMIDKRNGRKGQIYRHELQEILKKRLLSEIQIAKHCEVSQALVRFWRLGERAIQDKEYRKIKELLNLGGNLKEAERKKIGKGKPHVSGEGKNNSWDSGYKLDYDITNPTTDLAKHWDGFKVGGIKPAYEPIIWAVKPPEGSYIDNVLKWGVGAVNVDECRIGLNANGGHWTHKRKGKITYSGKLGDGEDFGNTSPKGRFPANIILSHHPECVQVGAKRVKAAGWKDSDKGNAIYINKKIKTDAPHYADPDGFETVESWDCHPDCAVRLLDEQSGMLSSGENPKRRGSAVFKNCYGEFQGQENCLDHYSRGANSGGASRFFYCAKASRVERNAGLEEKGKPITKHNARPCDWEKADWSKRNTNNHPTVKPIKLFEWLIKLVTREHQIILDPFIGSGTTGIAAHNTGRKYVGIEKEEEYIEIATRRVAHWRSLPKQLEII